MLAAEAEVLTPDGPVVRTYLRVDAKVDGAVNITDTLFIARYLLVIRGVGDNPQNEVNAVNSPASKRRRSLTR